MTVATRAPVRGSLVRQLVARPEPARSVARDWIRLRYRLLPYVLAEAAAAAAGGLPFARPLVLEFPDDPATWRLGDQFLCGRSLLAAPLFEPGGHRRAYLPPGPGRTGGTGSGSVARGGCRPSTALAPCRCTCGRER